MGQGLQLDGRVERIPDAGDFIVFEVGRESFLVVRGEDGAIRAFFNGCPQRGSRLAIAGGSVGGGFTCPFHRWQFGLDGRLAQVTDRETFRPGALCRGLDLAEVRCADPPLPRRARSLRGGSTRRLIDSRELP